MEENEMLETTNETENVETQPTEEIEEGIELTDTTSEELEKESVKPSLLELLRDNPDYQAELDERIIKPRVARLEKNHQKELSKYVDTENVLKATIGGNDTAEVNQKLREYYESEGVKLPDVYKPGLSHREIELLARGDAEDFINEGYDSMVNEANRLANIGYKNLNEREQCLFDNLVEKINYQNDKNEIEKLGAKEEILADKQFIDFRNQFNRNTPIRTVYQMYQKENATKKNIKPMGDMKDSITDKEKDFYSPEDVEKLTPEEWDKPGVFEKVRESQKKWKM